MEKGTLVINKTKNGFEYKLEYINKKGQTKRITIQKGQQCFDTAKAENGDAVEYEMSNGQLVKCVIPGKEANAPKVKSWASANPPAADANASNRTPAPVKKSCKGIRTAVAPYNFVPFKHEAAAHKFAAEPRRWSGKIICSITALTPLLVSGKQSDKNDGCRFMERGGKKIIPGTSIKGMLRSLIEIMSFSNMLPVTDKRLFWRQVTSKNSCYRDLLPHLRENPADHLRPFLKGGYLRKSGAVYTLYRTEVNSVKFSPNPLPPVFRTGGIKVHGKDSSNYHFPKPHDLTGEIIDQEVIDDLERQLTPGQEQKMEQVKNRKKFLQNPPGLPVFYQEDENKKITALGFCRYFRLKYKYSPFQLAYNKEEPRFPDLATLMFGNVKRRKDSPETLKGRIAVESAEIKGALYKNDGIEAVLGTPKPTCLPMYLDQCDANIDTMSKGTKNKPESLNDYNEKSSRLRGFKLYWHHDAEEEFIPKPPPGRPDKAKNENIASRLFPVAAGANGRFAIHIDRLTDTELGCLLEAIELPNGFAHKLGMGKSLGFGSVRLEIESAQIMDIRTTHDSLANRLAIKEKPEMDLQKRQELREHFRKEIFTVVKENVRVLNKKDYADWQQAAGYETLPPVKYLRIMLDFAHRPKAEAVRTMKLREEPGDPLTRINFGIHAILPYPDEINRNPDAGKPAK